MYEVWLPLNGNDIHNQYIGQQVPNLKGGAHNKQYGGHLFRK